MIVGDDDRIGIERGTQIDHRVRIRIGERSACDEIEDARVGGERFLHLLVAQRFLGRR